MYLRELEPGELAMFPWISDVDHTTYFVDEELGLGEPTNVPYPDDYVDGVMYRAWIDTDGNLLYYHEYAKDDPVGTLDTRDIYVPNQIVIDEFGLEPKVVFHDGRAHIMWGRYNNGVTQIEFSMHDGEAWRDPVIFGEHTHNIAPMKLTSNPDGDVLAAWTPGGCGGPCLDDPAMLARYDAASDCWTVIELESGVWDPRLLPFSFTPDVALTTVGPNSARGRIVSW